MDNTIKTKVRGFKFVDGGIELDNDDNSTILLRYDDIIDSYDKEQEMIAKAKESGEIIILGVSHFMLEQKLVFSLSNGAILTVTDDEIIKFYKQIKEQENKPIGGMDMSGLGALFGALAGGQNQMPINAVEITDDDIKRFKEAANKDETENS